MSAGKKEMHVESGVILARQPVILLVTFQQQND